MSFLASLFAGRKPTSSDADAVLVKLRSDQGEALAGISTSEATLRNLATLTDDEHAAAEAALLSGRRAKARIEAQIAEIEEARDAAIKAEASAAFFARRDGADKLMAVDYLKAETKLRHAFERAAEAAAEMIAIDEKVVTVNREITAARKADKLAIVPEPVPTADERYRSEPDQVTPATTFEIETVCVDGPFGPEPAGVTSTRNGKVVLHAGEFLRTLTKTNPEQRRPGRRMMSPTSNLVLPPTRIGEAPFWPKEGR